MGALPNPNIDWAHLRPLATHGFGLGELARQFHLPAGAVLARARRENWRISAINNGRKLAAQPIIEKAAQVSRDFVRDNGLRSRAFLSTAVAKAASHLENLPAPVIVEKHQALEAVTRAGNKLHGWSSEAEADRLAVVNLAVLATPASALRSKEAREVQAQSESQAQLDDSD
jgi:hypothetical protein